MAEKDLQQQLLEVQLETAQIQRERAQEENAEYKARKVQKKRANEQRQEQLRIDVANRKFQASRCKHRQGGTPRNVFAGTGKTSLNRVLMPDGFTKRISCSICRMVLFSPFPPNQNKRNKKGESDKDRDARVKKFAEDSARFTKFWEQAEDTLTPEASQIMDSGTKFTVTNEDGMPIFKPRPCDSYAMQL